jgi:TonB family protein
MEAVRQYIYQPRPGAEIQTTVTVSFRLDGGFPSAVEMRDAAEPGLEPSVSLRNSAVMLSYKVEPVYPMEDRAAQIQGTVTLSITVGADGLPKDPRVLQSAGFGLDEQALDAVLQWRFKPPAMDSTAIVEFHFRLQ